MPQGNRNVVKIRNLATGKFIEVPAGNNSNGARTLHITLTDIVMTEKIFNWYGVKLLYINRVLGAPSKKRIDDNYIEDYIAYEESVIVIRAISFDEAYQKVENLAKENEDDYQNYYDQTVQIRFHSSIDCYFIGEEDEIDKLEDGVEVYSNIFEAKASKDQGALLKELFPIDDKPLCKYP